MQDVNNTTVKKIGMAEFIVQQGKETSNPIKNIITVCGKCHEGIISVYNRDLRWLGQGAGGRVY